MQACLSVITYTSQVGLPVPLVRRRALFWVNHGILTLTSSASPNPRTSQQGNAASSTPQQPQQQSQQQQPGVYQRASTLRPSLHGSTVVELGLEEDAPTQLPTAIDSLVSLLLCFEL